MARFNVIERRLERFMQEPASVRTAVGVIVVATITVVVGGGVLIRVLDPDEYADVWTGMWWSLQTVTTVGYGDVTPGHFSGRLVGAVVMLEGTAFIAIITAAITSNFVARATRAYAAAQADEGGGDLQRLEQRFDELERKLDLLLAARGRPHA
jgi:voltage-gated potassium channel Kch